MDMNNEEELKALKNWLNGMLKIERVTVTFTKQDGSERTMKCTTNPMFISARLNKDVDLENKTLNEDVCTVFDLEINDWRSFRYQSVKRIEFELLSEEK